MTVASAVFGRFSKKSFSSDLDLLLRVKQLLEDSLDPDSDLELVLIFAPDLISSIYLLTLLPTCWYFLFLTATVPLWTLSILRDISLLRGGPELLRIRLAELALLLRDSWDLARSG